MIKFMDVNDEMRNILLTQYSPILMQHLKCRYQSLYKKLVGLLYADDYRMLCYKDILHELDEDEAARLEYYMYNINDMNKLLSIVEEEPELLKEMIPSTAKIYLSDIVDKANIYTCVDDNYICEFNKYSIIEKANIIGERDKFDFIYEVKKGYKKSFYQYKNNDFKSYVYDKGIDHIYNMLTILEAHREKNYKKMLLEMSKSFYRNKKFIEADNPNGLTKYEKDIITIIEKGEPDYTVYKLRTEENLLISTISGFLQYELLFDSNEKLMIDGFFDKLDKKNQKKKK